LPAVASARGTPLDPWSDALRNKAISRGITEKTYTRVMRGIHPDTTGLEAIRNRHHRTTLAVQSFQRKIGMVSADGYAGVGLLARLRQGS
jgi:hypothetical protein